VLLLHQRLHAPVHYRRQLRLQVLVAAPLIVQLPLQARHLG
jgi:hypothetical protein